MLHESDTVRILTTGRVGTIIEVDANTRPKRYLVYAEKSPVSDGVPTWYGANRLQLLTPTPRKESKSEEQQDAETESA